MVGLFNAREKASVSSALVQQYASDKVGALTEISFRLKTFG